MGPLLVSRTFASNALGRKRRNQREWRCEWINSEVILCCQKSHDFGNLPTQ